jgi:hypothetical protein
LYQDPEIDEVPLESENETTVQTDTDQQAIPNKGETNDKKRVTYKNSKKKNQQPLNTVTNTIMKTSTAKATKQPLIYETDGGSKRLRANKAREKQPSRYYSIHIHCKIKIKIVITCLIFCIVFFYIIAARKALKMWIKKSRTYQKPTKGIV